MNSGDFSSYQLRDPATSPVMLNSSNVSNASSFQSTGSNSNNNQHRNEEEQDKKRQLRLQKNREAAKECRRKKKEYIKCLEDRVSFDFSKCKKKKVLYIKIIFIIFLFIFLGKYTSTTKQNINRRIKDT